ncbi:MAG TPA: aspartyl/asparaginyl beta-hydroxylase domain-containing protein [Candidatus Cybelea sp.]|jgi:hypothetical protein|nr:aspartyl/asparaginyl beta-hydroxylase domain-containing protein [Candidatus Cybelea sp.]
MIAHPIGSVAFDDGLLAKELETIERQATTPCTGYAHGSWAKCILAMRHAGESELRTKPAGEAAPHLMERIRTTFAMTHVKVVQLFAASNGGFVRPHVDWKADAPLCTRLHVPLRTNRYAFNSEDDVVFQMGYGEVWFLDASRPHSGGCFSTDTRLHLIVDLEAADSLESVFAERSEYAPSRHLDAVALPELTSTDRSAIDGLAKLVTDANLGTMLDFLGAIHFQRRVDCAQTYEWLLRIAEGSGDAHLVSRAREYRRMYLTPFE